MELGRLKSIAINTVIPITGRGKKEKKGMLGGSPPSSACRGRRGGPFFLPDRRYRINTSPRPQLDGVGSPSPALFLLSRLPPAPSHR